jgi:hypothetical protein
MRTLALQLALGCGTQPPTDALPKLDAPTAHQPHAAPTGAIGVVDGGYPLFGSPPSYLPWPSAEGLERSFDVTPVVLTKPIPEGVRLLVVPLINALDKPRLDALAAAIDSGMPAIIIADPFALKWLEPESPSGGASGAETMRMRAHNVGSEGDAMGLLRSYGVDWDDRSVLEQVRQPRTDRYVDVVQVSPVRPGGAGLRDVVAIYPGRLEPMGGDFEPLLVAWGDVVSKPSAFNYDSGGDLEFEDEGRSTPLEGPVVLAARTSGEGRGDVTVIADQDLFADPLQSKEASEMLVRLAAPYVEPFRPVAATVGAPLLPVDPSEVASIELVDRSPGPEIEAAKTVDTKPYNAVFVGSARDALAQAKREGRWGIQRIVRLHRTNEGWALDTGWVREVETSAPVSRLLQAFSQAKLAEPPASNTQPHNPNEGPPATLRVVMRDAQGRRVADVVLDNAGDDPMRLRVRGTAQRFVAALDFESNLDAFEKQLEPAFWKDAERPLDLGDYGIIGR